MALGVGHGWQVDAAVLAVLGVGFYMLHNSFQTQITEVLPEARASAIAFHAFSFFIGQALGVVAVGAALAGFGWTATAFLCAAAAVALGLVSAWYLVWKPGTGAPR